MKKSQTQIFVLAVGILLLLYGTNLWRMDITPTIVTVFSSIQYDYNAPATTSATQPVLVPTYSSATQEYTVTIAPAARGGTPVRTRTITLSLYINNVLINATTVTVDDSVARTISILQPFTAAPNISHDLRVTMSSTSSYSFQATLDGTISYYSGSSPPPSFYAVLTINAGTGGTTNPAPDTYTYTNSSTITVSATPNSGYYFAVWVLSGTNYSSVNPISGPPSNNTLTALFETSPPATPPPDQNTTLPPNPPDTPNGSPSPPPTNEPNVPTDTGGGLALMGIVLIVTVLGFGALSKRREKHA